MSWVGVGGILRKASGPAHMRVTPLPAVALSDTVLRQHQHLCMCMHVHELWCVCVPCRLVMHVALSLGFQICLFISALHHLTAPAPHQ